MSDDHTVIEFRRHLSRHMERLSRMKEVKRQMSIATAMILKHYYDLPVEQREKVEVITVRVVIR